MKTSAQMLACSGAALAASASAFVSPMGVNVRSVAKSSSSLRMSDGASYTQSLSGKPFGNDFVFDPLGLSEGASPKDIRRWREAEIKHGRVAMLASLGVLVQESFHPFFLTNSDIGPAKDHFQEIATKFPQFWPACILGVALIEYNQIKTTFENPEGTMTGEAGVRDDIIPGDLGFDPLGLKPSDPEGFATMQTKELNNGRLAMIGVAGMLVQELVKPEAILDFLS